MEHIDARKAVWLIDPLFDHTVWGSARLCVHLVNEICFQL